MKRRDGLWRWAVVAGLALTALLGRPAVAAPDPFEPKSVRWEEDYAWLKTSDVTPVGLERLKFVPLTADRGAWLTLGGEARQRVDSIDHGQLGLGAADYYRTAQTRLYLHADAHLGAQLRLFAQLSYADEGGRRPRERPFDESAPDVQQLFVDLTPTPALRLRLGRQELPLGDQRLSEVRETYNLRRSFDGTRADLALGRATVTAFRAGLILNRPDAFDDRREPGEIYQGVYVTVPLRQAAGGLDLFWLGRERNRSVFTEGVAKERRETFGARLHGTPGALDYNLYLVGQTGRFGAAPIRAWAASVDAGWTITDLAWRPRFGLRVDVASGDSRRGDGRLGSFDAPYPNTSYLSTSSAYWPGNAWSVFPLVTVHPRETFSASVGGQVMGLMSLQDGFYYSAQNPLPAATGHGRGAMTQIYLRAKWQPTRNWSVSGTVIRQMAGDPIVAIGGQDSTIVSVATGFKF